MAYEHLCGVLYNHELQERDCLAEEQRILQLDMKSVTAADLEVSLRVAHVAASSPVLMEAKFLFCIQVIKVMVCVLF